MKRASILLLALASDCRMSRIAPTPDPILVAFALAVLVFAVIVVGIVRFVWADESARLARLQAESDETARRCK